MNNRSAVSKYTADNCSSIVRKKMLTAKEKKLKDRLFRKKKKKEEKEPRGLTITKRLEESLRKGQGLPEEQADLSETIPKNQPTTSANMDKEMAKFMDEMTHQAQKMGSEALSRQMLQDQNSLLREHARILGENQEVLKKVISSHTRKKTEDDYNSQRLVIAEMLKPFMDRVSEVKRLFERSKDRALDVNHYLKDIKQQRKFNNEDNENEQKFPGVFSEYATTQNQLRKKFSEIERMTKFYKRKFKDIENFEAANYLGNLQRMNNEMSKLEARSKEGQAELERRIEMVNKKYNLMLPATYIDLIEKNIMKIDYVKTSQKIARKLGGEVDYKQFKLDVEEIVFEFKQAVDDFELKKKETALVVPKLDENHALEYINSIEKAPSVLTDIKNRIAKMKRGFAQAGLMPDLEGLHAQHHQANQPISAPSDANQVKNQLYWNRHSQGPGWGGQSANQAETVRKPKKPMPNKRNRLNYIKPDYLNDLRTQPIPCQPVVKYKKLQPEADDYNTMFERPPPHDYAEVNRQQNLSSYDAYLMERGQQDPRYNTGSSGGPGSSQQRGEQPTRRYMVGFRHKHDMMCQTVKDHGVGTEEQAGTVGMATDDFLRTFGNQESRGTNNESRARNLNSRSGGGPGGTASPLDDLFNVIDDYNASAGGVTSSGKGGSQGKKMTIYSNDLDGETRRMMVSKGLSEDQRDPKYRQAIEDGLKSNMGSIRDFFKKKQTKKPFQGFKPPPGRREESDGRHQRSRSRNQRRGSMSDFLGRDDFEGLSDDEKKSKEAMEEIQKEKSQPKLPENRLHHQQASEPVNIDSIANNIVSIFNKALSKAAADPRLVGVNNESGVQNPQKSTSRILSNKDKKNQPKKGTNKDSSYKDVLEASQLAPGGRQPTESDEGLSDDNIKNLNLDDYYNNFGAPPPPSDLDQHDQDKLKRAEDSIALDLEKYTKQLSETLADESLQSAPRLHDVLEDGEVRFGTLFDVYEGEQLLDDAEKANLKKKQKESGIGGSGQDLGNLGAPEGGLGKEKKGYGLDSSGEQGEVQSEEEVGSFTKEDLKKSMRPLDDGEIEFDDYLDDFDDFS